MTSGNITAESRQAQHANSDLTHLFTADEQVIYARWPSTPASVTTGLLTSDSLKRELGYVGLSRGRYDNRIWTTSDRDPDVSVEAAHGAEREAPDPLADLRHAMATSGAHQLATDLPTGLDPDGIEL